MISSARCGRRRTRFSLSIPSSPPRSRYDAGPVSGTRLSFFMPLPLRLSLFYAAYFLTLGIQLPFWPVWLESRGLGPGEIGVVLSAALWVRIVTIPAAGVLADRTGSRQ